MKESRPENKLDPDSSMIQVNDDVKINQRSTMNVLVIDLTLDQRQTVAESIGKCAKFVIAFRNKS